MMFEVPREYLTETFRIEYNPNCPSAFLVRLCVAGRITGTRLDACGYGATLPAAFEAAARDRGRLRQVLALNEVKR